MRKPSQEAVVGSWGGGLSPAGGAVGLVLARQAGTSSLGSCPRGQQGPHWRVTSCTWAPGGHGSSQLRATGFPLSSCCSGVGPVTRSDIHPRTEGQSYNENGLPSGTSPSRDTWTGVRPLQRLPHCPQSSWVFPAEEGRRQGPSVTIPVI